jgi:hypothetical protein
MNRFKKLALTAAALAALAVGGAAFAQAQSGGSGTQAPTEQSAADPASPGDTDNVQEGPQGPDVQGGPAEPQGTDAEQTGEQPETAPESDGPGGHHDEPAGATGGQETQED